VNTSTAFRVQAASSGTLFFIEIPGFGLVRVSGTEPIGQWSRLN